MPVALTATVVERYILVPDDDGWDDEKSRVWDLLETLAHFIRCQPQEEVYFRCVDHNTGRLVWLKMLVTPNDDAEMVMTIMLPEEG